ncbi:maltose O-acetyltransferase [Cellulomonas chitinilytica]|uniref:Acetyltransferase n=1 Tax=Cellulomonas chitinilytica TaxID=398759 RepID=A0A919TYX8_9CELL|nr:sugar O-acetyltransferase [Cellulomonas chitinilytica]GIG20228.1 maltose O-acetyltransferase [Cellulomonas chitinilytica]
MNEDTRTQYERMVAGDWYEADAEIHALTAAAHVRSERFAEAVRAGDDDAVDRLRELLGSLGEASWIRPPLHVDLGVHLHLGARSYVNFGLVALDVAHIRIGDDTKIGPNVQLLTPIHPVDPEPRRAKLEAAEPITIGDNVWLGGGVIVCPGVTIGDNTVVGAGAVVTTDLPANVLAVGNPARVVRSI